MRYRNVRNLVIEGPDGCGKSTLIQGLFKHYNYKYMCYHRGELSNKVYAEKFGRPFYETQRGLPLLYIFLFVNEPELERRISKRALEEGWTEEDLQHELSKVKDIWLFNKAYDKMQKNYDMFAVNTSFFSAEETLECIIKYLDEREKEDQEMDK